MNVIKNLGNSMGKGGRAFLTGLMLLTSNQLFQACKTTDSNITPVDTLTPLQAAKNSMRNRLEAQYGSIDKIMEKGITIVAYMSYPDTQTPEQFYGTQIYKQMTDPTSVAQINQMFTDLMQPYLKGIKINLDFQLLPLTKEDMGNITNYPNNTTGSIYSTIDIKYPIGKNLNSKFIDYNKTKILNGESVSTGFIFCYDTAKLGLPNINGGGLHIPVTNNGISYSSAGAAMQLSNGLWDNLKIVAHEIIGHGLTDLGVAMHNQDSYYLGKKKNDGTYEIIPTKGGVSLVSSTGLWQYTDLSGYTGNLNSNDVVLVNAINQNGGVSTFLPSGGILLGGIFDPKIVGPEIVGYKFNQNGTLDKKITIKLPEVPAGFALPDVSIAAKNNVMKNTSSFISAIVNDVKAP